MAAPFVEITFFYTHTHHLTPTPLLYSCRRRRLSLSTKPQQQKNTCAHNNTHKAHANGIKKKKRTKYVSTRGMDPKFLRNQKFCKKYNNAKRVHDDE
ncbi:hypothetical protein ACHAXR_001658 [Thalassiosira sp. AJA248-18]